MIPDDLHAFAERIVLGLFAGRSFLTINEAITLVEGAISCTLETAKTPCL